MSVLDISKSIRAAAMALVLGGTAFVGMPAAQAASPSFEFNFSIGNSGAHWRGGSRPTRHCLTNRQVRRDLRRDGYRQIRFTDRRGRIVHVKASLGWRDFRIAYNTCRGRIIDRDRIRRRW